MVNGTLTDRFKPGSLRVAVVGGGNIGTQFACTCAAKGYAVNVFSSRPNEYDGELEIVDENGTVTKGKIIKAVSDIGEAVSGCGVVFITHPAFLFKSTAAALLPYVHEDMRICVLPGTGGAEFVFGDCIAAGATLFGLQRVPGVARLEKYGKRVRAEGKRDELFLAAIPNESAGELADFIAALFDIKCYTLPNYLSVTLTPSNPILHTTRLRTLFADYRAGDVYEKNPMFYGEWSDASSELLLQCDSELQNMCGMIPGVDLTNVRSLRLHYESDTAEALTRKMRSIPSLHNLTSPMKRVEGGWVPDFSSRYFTADFPYGLAIIEELADLLNYDAPHIRATMAWYRDTVGNRECFDLGSCGIHAVQDLCDLYR